MSNFLFVYGTLQFSHAQAEIAHAVEKLRVVGRANIPGVLYDLGDYPGAVLGADETKKIAGQVLELPDNPEILKQLDDYEEFEVSSPEHSLFVRVLRPVQLSSGETLNCWVYTYNKDPGNAPVIAHGRFSAKSN